LPVEAETTIGNISKRIRKNARFEIREVDCMKLFFI